MKVGKLSMASEKLKFDKIMSMLYNNRSIVSFSPSSYGCTCEVANHSNSTAAQIFDVHIL